MIPVGSTAGNSEGVKEEKKNYILHFRVEQMEFSVILIVGCINGICM